MTPLDQAQRRLAMNEMARAIQLLCGAGACLVDARKFVGPENAAAHELITALRDDIQSMVGTVETLRDVIQGR